MVFAALLGREPLTVSKSAGVIVTSFGVGIALDKRKVEEFFKLLLWRTGCKVEVELLKRLYRRKAGSSREDGSSSLLSLAMLSLK